MNQKAPVMIILHFIPALIHPCSVWSQPAIERVNQESEAGHYYEIVLTCNDALCQGDQLGWDVRYAAVFTLQVHQVMLCGLSAGQETLN